MAGMMLRKIFRFGRRGAVASEFAIVGVAMLSVLFLAVEVVYAMVARGAVEAGLERATRIAATGAPIGPPVPTMVQRYGAFNMAYSTIVGGIADYPSTITNTFASYMKIEYVLVPPTSAELIALGLTMADVITTDLGKARWFTVYSSTYRHPLLTGMLFCNLIPYFGCDGHLRMEFRIMRQNEPFE